MLYTIPVLECPGCTFTLIKILTMKPIADAVFLEENALAEPRDGQPAFAGLLPAFVRQQIEAWPGLRQAHEGLAQSLYKRFFLRDLEVTLQHNPCRVKSSSAQVDKASIAARACFLCPENLYPEQRALAFGREWLVLCNPFPIFPEHLVVSHREHVPQEIGACLRDMLAFVRDAGGGFEAFYNGPACGASAPDHLHFQAYPAGGIPLVEQAQLLIAAGMGFELSGDMAGQGACWLGEADRRGALICRSADAALVECALLRAVSFLRQSTAAQGEPLINVIAAADGPELIGMLLPRKAHRPGCYFLEEPGRMLVSPGAVDVGGLLVLPRREDYDRLTREQVLGIFSEVCHGKEIFRGLDLSL